MGFLRSCTLTAGIVSFALIGTASGAFVKTAQVRSCVTTKNGALRIIGETASCASGEQLLVWNKQGPPGPAGPQGLAGSGVLFVKDLNGEVLGVATSFAIQHTGVLYSLGNSLIRFFLTPLGFSQSLNLGYQSADCSGQGLVYGFTTPPGIFALEGQIKGTTLYYATNSGSPTMLHSGSLYPTTAANCPNNSTQTFIPPDTCCFSFGAGLNEIVSPFATTDLSNFVPPFHLELSQ